MEHEVVVIGAGSAGAVVAARLSEDPGLRVLLLEAGNDYPRYDALPAALRRGVSGLTLTEHLWGYLAQASAEQQPSPLPRGRVLGGTGAINGQIWARGLPEDFTRWVERGCAGWGPRDVAPVFRALENDLDHHDREHGTGGPVVVRRPAPASLLPFQQAFYAACLDAGFPDCPDMNAPGSTGIGPFPFSTADGSRAGTAQTHLDPARGRPNLTVRGQAQALRLRIGAGGRVEAVDVGTPAGIERVTGATFVLCGGAIGTPHLLQQSGVGPAAWLAAAGLPVTIDLPGVGRHLQDHPIAQVFWSTGADHPYPAQDEPMTQLALRYTAAGSTLLNDMKITARSLTKRNADGSPPALPGTVAIVPDLELELGSGEVRPVSDDPVAHPRINLGFLTEAEDRRRLRDGVRLALRLARHPAVAPLLGPRTIPSDADLASDAAADAWLLRTVRTSHHLCGTAKMGAPDDERAVTDTRGRVRGLANVRVADASVFPEIVRANTNATAIMAAERLAAMLRDDLARG